MSESFILFSSYVDYNFETFLYYHYSYGDLNKFLHDCRFVIARKEQVPWERVQLKLVENVNGAALTLPVVAS